MEVPHQQEKDKEEVNVIQLPEEEHEYRIFVNGSVSQQFSPTTVSLDFQGQNKGNRN